MQSTQMLINLWYWQCVCGVQKHIMNKALLYIVVNV